MTIERDAREQLRQTAHTVGAADVLVFRRLSGTRYAHIGGSGRGEGWAGIVEVSLCDEPLASSALDSHDRLTRWESDIATRVIGPYFACEAALVTVSTDLLVVFGNPQRSELLRRTPALTLLALACVASETIKDVSPSKRLADELEVLTAVREMTVATTGSLPDTLAHVAQVTTSALSCDLGVVVTSDGQFAVAGALGPDALGPESIAELHAELLSMTAPRCVQDAAVVAPPEPLASLGGVRAWFAIPIPDPAGGWLLLCHTNARPRGFTDLCQRLGVQLAEAAAILVHVASLRDGLVRELERETGHARRDPLTEVLNRRGWQDALEEMGYRCRDSVISIMTVDVDGLKQINDSEGHQAGDTLLCMVAETLLDNVRVGDIVARIGGDEFAVLLPDTDEATVQTVADRVREKSIAMSVGVATCLGTGDLDAAIHLADQRMYAEKRRNRPSVGVPVQPGQETQVARSA